MVVHQTPRISADDDSSVCIISIIRIIQVKSVSFTDSSCEIPHNLRNLNRVPTETQLGSDAPGSMWSIVETNMGLVGACLPTLRPTFNFVFYGRANTRASTTQMKSTSSRETLAVKLHHLRSQLSKGPSTLARLESVNTPSAPDNI